MFHVLRWRKGSEGRWWRENNTKLTLLQKKPNTWILELYWLKYVCFSLTIPEHLTKYINFSPKSCLVYICEDHQDYIENSTVGTKTWKFHSANILEFHRNSAVTVHHRLYRTPVSSIHMGEEKISRAADTLTDLPCCAASIKKSIC